MTACPDTAKAEALGRYLKQRMGADAVTVVAFSRLSGGAIQDNYALTVECRGGPYEGTHELVVRSDAPSKVAASLPRSHEFRVLQVAFEAGVTVPEPLWMCEDTSVIGVPFCIMARVAGVPSGRKLVRMLDSDDSGQGRALVRQLGEELARLHRVVPVGASAERLGFLPVPAEIPALARVQQYRAALDAIPHPHPVLEWALNWLEDNAMDSGLRALCHGDFRTGNYMVDAGTVTAILDWEFASWGDPYEDLGWLCARSWRFGAPEREVGGVGDRADLYTAWEAGMGTKVDDRQVRYWEVMGMVRWAIIALQQGQRHLSGEQASLELALTGRMLPEIELDILCAIEAYEGRPVAAESLQPRFDNTSKQQASEPARQDGSTGAPQGVEGSEFILPTANDLLGTARRSLLDDLLPQLPQHGYEALMVANAMAIAQRELQDGGRLERASRRAMQDFLKILEIDTQAQVASDAPRELQRVLRGRAVPAPQETALRRLLMADTCARLSLSNPKYLAGHQAGARASSTVASGGRDGKSS